MEIKELEINNFRSFKGVSKFDFTTNGERNIVLIGGENGAGKTSIFEAIKLSIYGPLTYRYQGMVPNYISRIKSMINEDTLKNANINSHVQLKILMNIDGEKNLYSLKREWHIIKGKLIEIFTIMKGDEKLEEDRKEIIESYLRNSIPPDVFDLFFFDGEKLSDFFDERNFEIKLKDTIITLNNFDVFNILKKELILNIRRKDKERLNLKELVDEAEVIEEHINDAQKKIDLLLEDIKFHENLKEELKINIHNINFEFIKAGGLNDKEKEDIINKIKNAEIKRDFMNQEIKEFSNNVLPFILVKDVLSSIKAQIYMEEDFQIYDTIKGRLDRGKITEIINKNLGTNIILNCEEIVKELEKVIIPQKFDENFKPIHCLSKEQQNKVISLIDMILKLDTRKINYFDEITYLTREIASLRKKLNSSLKDEEQEKYISKISNLNSNLNKIEIKISNLGNEVERLKEEKSNFSTNLTKINEKINILKKADNIKEISHIIIDMIDELLASIIINKKEEIEGYFKNIFNEIIRKEKFIDFICVEDDFKITLYLRKTFYNNEIKRMVINLGIEEMEKKFGRLFIEGLYEYTGYKERKNILVSLNEKSDISKIELDTKIDVMNLSSGEKQVYILCLYWALIKSSDIDIPFIIDTPYGRIDEKHRKAITTKFFPRISNQVIILSTNTEIEEGLYGDINQYVSKEYTLEYDVESRKTTIKEGYFYEVK